MIIRWNHAALDFVELYGLDRRIVEDAVRMPQTTSMDPRTRTMGYPINRLFRGDVEVVVGYREPEEPTILYVRLNTPGDQQTPHRSGGGVSGSSLPPTLAELHRRIIMAGYYIDSTSTHAKVMSHDGVLILRMAKTPSDRRSIANAWRTFVKADRDYRASRRDEKSDDPPQ